MKRAPSRPPELPGYDYERVLGSGGFSDVFLYQQRLPRRKVAVKVLLTDELNPATRQSFVAEANVMAQLSAHPSIVTIFHADVAADLRPYFVMEYCAGPSLAERYKRERFTVEDTLRIGIRLAGAVATAHAAGILHRDIKPANVLSNDYGWPALTDFGISSTLEGELPVHTTTFVPGNATITASNQSAIGLSVPWSPPEMFEDEPMPDVRSDEFSLAATLHTLLTGRSPFEDPQRSNSALELIARIERGEVSPIARDDVSASLRAVLARGMAMRREQRYATVLEFARALQRVEIELGYAPTPIELPQLVTLADNAQTDDADETKARNFTSIAAQRPTGHAGSALTGSQNAVTPPERPTTPVVPQGYAAHNPAQTQVDDGTVVRAVPEHTVGSETIFRHTHETEALPKAQDAAPRRRKGVVVVAAVAAVALLGAVVAAIALGGLGAEESQRGQSVPRNTSTAQGEGAGGAAIVSDVVPTPTLASVANAPDGDGVVFSMVNPEPQDGDSFRWFRTDDSEQKNLSKTAEITVPAVSLAEKVCIEVSVQRSSGKLSAEPARVCTQ